MSSFRNYRSTYNIAGGFRQDLDRLLTLFTAKTSLRYEAFCQVWKELQMGYIFAGRSDRRELREFVEELLYLTLNVFSSSDCSLQNRVACFYTLYAIYSLQALKPKVQIRVTPLLWEALLLFISDMHEQGHLDVEYIFHKLKWDGAFTAVATEKPVYLEKLSLLQGAPAGGQMSSESSIVSDILEPDNISELGTIHEQYHRVKCHLAGANATEPKPAINVINNNLVQYITKVVTSHEEWKHKKGDMRGRKRRDSGGATTTTSESEADSDVDYLPKSVKQAKKTEQTELRNKRAEIRARAFEQVSSRARKRANQHSSRSSGSGSEARSPNKRRNKSGSDYLDASTDDIKFPLLSISEQKDDESSEDEWSSKPNPRGRGRGRGRGARRARGRPRGSRTSTPYIPTESHTGMVDMPTLVDTEETKPETSASATSEIHTPSRPCSDPEGGKEAESGHDESFTKMFADALSPPASSYMSSDNEKKGQKKVKSRKRKNLQGDRGYLDDKKRVKTRGRGRGRRRGKGNNFE